jgi:hypothetical protein
MARQNEADRRPKTYPSGTVGTITPNDNNNLATICSVLVVSCTVAGNIVVRMLDGNNATIAVPVGVTQLELQFDRVLSTGLTATATFVGLYNL